jgi:ZIP family zinc transporter
MGLQQQVVNNITMSSIEIVEIVRVIAMAAFAGGTSFVGGLIARYVKFSDRQTLFFTAFGAGILISAAIFGMVIEAEKTLGIIVTLSAFVGGSIVFTIADMVAERKGGGAGILLGIGLDSIPESLAIGASVAGGAGFVIALLIGIQNVPEGIASFREMTSGKTTAFRGSKRKALIAIGLVSIIPIFLGLVGLFFMQGMQVIISLTLAISAGGIFYMLFYDMIPKAHKERNWLPTFAAVLGFIIGFALVRVIR